MLFYILFTCFVFSGGYLPLNFFQWTNLNGNASHHYILARCYTTDELCRSFGSINKELLPLCAVLAGNDYGTPKDADKIIHLLGVSGIWRGGGRGSASISRIEGFLRWLSSFKFPADVLEEVRILMGEEVGGIGGKRGHKGGLSSQLWEGMQEYHITTPSALAHWFSEGKTAPRGQSSWLPEFLSRAAAQGLLAPLVVDALVMHRVLLIPQVENSRLASSHCCASAIRQAIYTIILERGQDCPAQDMRAQENISQGMRGGRGRRGRGGGGGVGQVIILPTQQSGNSGFSFEQADGAATVSAQGYGAPMCVEEYDRMDLNLKKNNVETHPHGTPLRLDTIDQVRPQKLCPFSLVLSDLYTFPNVVPPFYPGSCGSSSRCPVRSLGIEGVCAGSCSSPPEAGCSSDSLLAARGQTLTAPAPGFVAGHGLWRAVPEQPAWSAPLPTYRLVVLYLLYYSTNTVYLNIDNVAAGYLPRLGCGAQRASRAGLSTCEARGETGLGCRRGSQFQPMASLPLECTVSQSAIAAAAA